MDCLEVLYGEQWRIHKMTPMKMFEYRKILDYAQHILCILFNTVATTSNSEFKVIFEAVPTLRYTEADSVTLKITVTKCIKCKYRITDKTVYSALMISWGLHLDMVGATHLPYLLDRGDEHVGLAVKSTLETLFHCNIHPYEFSQLDLMKIFFKFLEKEHPTSTNELTLFYKDPENDNNDYVLLDLTIADVITIWNLISLETENEDMRIQMANSVIIEHLFSFYPLSVDKLDICQVFLSGTHITINGLITMETPEIVNALFTELNRISQNLFLN